MPPCSCSLVSTIKNCFHAYMELKTRIMLGIFNMRRCCQLSPVWNTVKRGKVVEEWLWSARGMMALDVAHLNSWMMYDGLVPVYQTFIITTTVFIMNMFCLPCLSSFLHQPHVWQWANYQHTKGEMSSIAILHKRGISLRIKEQLVDMNLILLSEQQY